MAPIFNDASMAEYYLPAGTWTDFFTGEVVEGGRWISEKCGYLNIPLMVKENAIVALGAHDDKPDYHYADGVELRAYALQDGIEASTIVYDMDTTEKCVVSILKNSKTFSIHVKTNDTYTIRLVNVKASSVSGADMVIDGNDTVLSHGSSEITVTI